MYFGSDTFEVKRVLVPRHFIYKTISGHLFHLVDYENYQLRLQTIIYCQKESMKFTPRTLTNIHFTCRPLIVENTQDSLSSHSKQKLSNCNSDRIFPKQHNEIPLLSTTITHLPTREQPKVSENFEHYVSSIE